MSSNNTFPEKIDAEESDYLYTDISGIVNAGKGLFTVIPIYKNEIISIFKGDILTNEESAQRAFDNQDMYFINMLDGTIMDSNNVDCFAKYANDVEALQNSIQKNNSKIMLDEDEQVCIVATRDIKAGQEIFCGYGKAYWKNFQKNITK